MHILILGGTQFVGRHIVEELLRGGHVVSVMHRGRTDCGFSGPVERLRGDRDRGAAGLAALAGRTWDVCIDVSGYTPQQVRASAELLRRQVERYVFVSAVSVYGDPAAGPVDETCPRVAAAGDGVTEITNATYGPLKVACENIVQEVFGERCTLLRPQIVAGPFDPFDRFSYWVRRAMQRGEMLAPGDGSDSMQVIDAGDCARFVRRVCEHEIDGVFNLSGPRLTWAEFLALLGARDLVWVPKEILNAAGVTESELPLYRPAGGPRSALMHVSQDRAIAAGLTMTELAVTIANVRDWLPQCNLAPALSPQREAELIQRTRGG